MRPHLLCAAAVLCLAGTLHAQSDEKARLGFEFASTRFSSTAHTTGSPSTTVSIDDPTIATLRFTSHIGAVGIGLSVGRIVNADFLNSTPGDPFDVVQTDQISLWEVAAEARHPVVKTAAGGRLYLHGGFTLDRWSVEGINDARSKFGVIAGMTLAGNVGNGWQVSLRVDGAASGAIFDDDEGGPGVELDRTERVQLGVGISRQL
jgi:hypothetical protein